MIENLQDELYQSENKNTKGAKLGAIIRSWRAKNVQNFLQSTSETEYAKLNNIWIINIW